MKSSLLFFTIILSMVITPSLPAFAATFYDPGVTTPLAATPSYVVGDHLVAPQMHPSVAGTGGSGISNAGDLLDGVRTYTYDTAAQPDLTDGVANRGDAGFAMLIWDMGQQFNSMRLYTHQDHYSGGPVTTNLVAQDLMEYSVWGSNDGDNFVLLSDVTGFNINGEGPGLPTYTFSGTEPTTVYRGGSSEFGIVNAYTRDYTFPSSYQYFGVRTSQVSLTIPGGGIDADPEIDAVIGFNSCPAGTVGEYPDCLPIDGIIGGEIIPIDTTSLLLAGAQSTFWIIPVTLAAAGVCAFFVWRKNE